MYLEPGQKPGKGRPGVPPPTPFFPEGGGHPLPSWGDMPGGSPCIRLDPSAIPNCEELPLYSAPPEFPGGNISGAGSYSDLRMLAGGTSPLTTFFPEGGDPPKKKDPPKGSPAEPLVPFVRFLDCHDLGDIDNSTGQDIEECCI